MSVPEIPEGQGVEMGPEMESWLERPPSPPGSYLSMESDEELPVNADSTPARVHLERAGSLKTKLSEIDQCSVQPKEGIFLPKHGVYPEGAGSLEAKQSPMEPCSVPTREEPVLPKHGSNAVRQPVSSRARDSELSVLKSMVLEKEKKLCPMGMPYIFKSIQTTLELLADEKLALFKKYLRRNYSQYFENQMEDSDVLDVVDKMLERCGKVGAVKTTLHTLKCMKMPDLAESLQKKCRRVMIQHDLRHYLKMRYDSIFEGIPIHGQHYYLNNIHVDVHMTEGGSGEVNDEHEVRQSEMASGRESGPEVVLKPSDLFEPSFVRERGIRTVLTRGIAGIGLTVAVQKFIVDWMHEKANQDIHFVFPLPELNLTEMKEQTLIEYLTIFYPQIKSMDFIDSPDCKVLFIFDGLDEYRHSLTFQTNGTWTDPRAPTSVDMLLTNLFRKKLLPDSLVWITMRTAACGMIDMGCVDLLTQVYGFTDSQKEQYLRKKIRDPRQANKIVAHVRSSRSLHIMAHIPVFSWMLATVFLEEISVDNQDDDDIMTTTKFFTHYMFLQANMMLSKYYGCVTNIPNWTEADRNFLMKLGKLGFKLLEKGAKEFHPGDLKDCGLDVNQAIVKSGLCTELFPQHSKSRQRVFRFVHLSVQEFMAAFYVYMSFRVNHRNVLDQTRRVRPPSKLFKRPTLVELLISAVDKALKSQNGHLDMFLRFVLGLSVDSIQDLFRPFITMPESEKQSIEETAQYIRKKMSENVNPDRCRNLPHCLTELEG